MEKIETTAKKLLPVYILEVLKKFSDAEHVLTQEQIAGKIESEFSLKVERKAIGRNMKLLGEAGYEIDSPNGKGYYYSGRLFDDTELRLLIDGVRFSRHVNKSVSNSLCQRLAGMGTVGFRKEIQLLEDVFPDSKMKTMELFHTIDVLKKAVSAHRKVAFRYFEYGVDGTLQAVWDESLVISPYELVYSNGNYYLIGQIEGNTGFTNFRLDKVKDAKLLKEECAKSLKLNMKKYLSAHPLMYSGEPVTATMRVNRFLMDSVWDFFGENIAVTDKGGNEDPDRIEVTVFADRWSIMEFALNNGYFAEVLSPALLRRNLREMARDALKKYSGD